MMNTKEKMQMIMVVLTIVVLLMGLLYIGMKLTHFNRAVVDPCGVCVELNQHLEKCFEDASYTIPDSTFVINVAPAEFEE